MLVDTHISTEIATRELGHIQPVMQNRPEHSIGESIVIFLVVLFGQIGQDIRLIAALNRSDRDV